MKGQPFKDQQRTKSFLSNDGSLGVIAETRPCPPDQPLTRKVQILDHRPTCSSVFNQHTAAHPTKGVGVAKAPYPLFHMEFSAVVDRGSSEKEKEQGPPTID